MDETHSMHEEIKIKCRILVRNLQGKRPLEDQSVGERIILKWLEVMDWIKLAQGRFGWRYVIITVMNYEVS